MGVLRFKSTIMLILEYQANINRTKMFFSPKLQAIHTALPFLIMWHLHSLSKFLVQSSHTRLLAQHYTQKQFSSHGE